MTIDWTRVDATTEAAIERQALDDESTEAHFDFSRPVRGHVYGSCSETGGAPVRITFEHLPGSVAVAYVAYREPFAAKRTLRISPNVTVDVSDGGEVLGIEIVGVDASSIATAAEFAQSQDLKFPRDLSGCAV